MHNRHWLIFATIDTGYQRGMKSFKSVRTSRNSWKIRIIGVLLQVRFCDVENRWVIRLGNSYGRGTKIFYSARQPIPWNFSSMAWLPRVNLYINDYILGVYLSESWQGRSAAYDSTLQLYKIQLIQEGMMLGERLI